MNSSKKPPKNPKVAFLRYLLPFWWQILLLFGGLLVQVWAGLQLPTIMATIIDQGIVNQNQTLIWDQGFRMLVVASLGGVGMIITGFFAARISTSLAANLRSDIFKKIISFSITEIDQFSTPSLITRTTNDVQQLQQTSVLLLRVALQSPVMAIGATIMAIATAPSLTWVIALSVGILLAVVLMTIHIVLPKFKIIQKLIDRLNLVTRENLTGLRVIRAFNNQPLEFKKFKKANDDVTSVNLFVGRAMSLLSPTIGLIFNFSVLGVIWFGAHLVESSTLAVGQLIAFMQYSIQVFLSFMFMTMTIILLPRAMVSWSRIREVLRTSNKIRPPDNPLTPKTAQGIVEFRDVTFAYPGADRPVLQNISFTSHPGTITAIIGSTGSGKSTLLNLIPRFYDTTKGQVLVDNINVRDYDFATLRKHIGFIPQKALLFTGTIAENIAFGTRATSRIPEAADIAQASEFIEKLEKTYSTPVTRGGNNFSGGQKQRLSIARALAKRPKIYLFDDSFSALDYKTDQKLRAALKTVEKDANIIIVAQRISTIRQADQILVLDEGQLVGHGTHADLMKSCSIYQEIARSQFSEAELKKESRTKKEDHASTR
ncbi:ABC transporter ATP-binding protein/permease [Candidatus Saccharibacteria bacterium]|nr:ABC transporter ATP-binding protein/permease [Candidatus Saccharibacteria bacterium]